MNNIFTSWKLKNLVIPNRLVRSATWEGMADYNGVPTDRLTNLIIELVKGGVGLVIMGYAFIHPFGRGLPYQTGIHTDDVVGSLARIADAVHKINGIIAMQIVHSGGQTKSEWIGRYPLGPTSGIHAAFKEKVVELSREQIFEIIDMFVASARRVKAAGFDAIQIHAAHGYLISEFLSPFTNKRIDEFGGSRENRERFCCDIYKAVRQEVGEDYPIFIKLNSVDGVEGGLKLDDAVSIAIKLSNLGIDSIEVSGGMAAAGKMGAARVVNSPEEEGYFLENAKIIKSVVRCPVIVVGGWRSVDRINQALKFIDAVGISRPFIREPNLANLWRLSSVESSLCRSCNECLRVGIKGGIFCINNK